MRLTLDKGAMEVLLNQMSPSARVDMASKVMRQVVEKLTTDITTEQFRRVLREQEKKELEGYLKRVNTWEPKLNESYREQLGKAYEAEQKGLIKAFRDALKDKEYEVRESAVKSVERAVDDYIHRRLNKLVDERVEAAIKDQLGSLFELGQAIRNMQTVTPENTDERTD